MKKTMMKKSKGYMAGGKTKGGMTMKSKGYKSGGKLKMVEKDGEQVPFFLAKQGGQMPEGTRMTTKMMAKGGMTSKAAPRGGVRGSGAARSQMFEKNG